jgi:uncharacterized protein (TIGR02145 family)
MQMIFFAVAIHATQPGWEAVMFDEERTSYVSLNPVVMKTSIGIIAITCVMLIYGCKKDNMPPSLTTNEVTSIMYSSATTGGTVTSEGSNPIIARGVCWDTAENPTIQNNKTDDGRGPGNYTSQVSGLLPNTNYFVRAFATNASGTAYGNSLSFKTPVPAVLTTNAISHLTYKSATAGGNITNDNGSAITARGICWDTAENPTILNNKTIDGQGSGPYTSQLTGLLPNTNYFVRAYATNGNGTAYGNSIAFKTLLPLTDVDGNYYDTLTIGTQKWMIQDLKTSSLNDGTPIPNVVSNTDWISLSTPGYCQYQNDISYKQTYGDLYNWYAVNTGKLCPSGWHVPGDSEWLTLINYLGGESTAGSKMKEIGFSHWLSPNTGATNQSGFTSLPSGDRIGADGSFYNLGGYAIYWSSDPDPTFPQKAINRVLVFDNTNMRIGYDNKTAGFSVRCIKN